MSPILSMTGFGSAEDESKQGAFSIEIKSVNHRFLEVRVNLPRELSRLELPLTRLVKNRLARGKVDATVRWIPSSDYQPKAIFDHTLLRHYEEEIRKTARLLGRDEPVSLECLLGLPGVMGISTPQLDESALFGFASTVLERALDALIAERRREGIVLEKEILARLEALEELYNGVESRRGEVQKAYRERLSKKAEEWKSMASLQLDPCRLEIEVLLYAERSDITEELVRLWAHIVALRQCVMEQNGSPIGKAMEFLAQELLREANTIASKSRDTEIASAVLAMKNEIEKIREQALNVE